MTDRTPWHDRWHEGRIGFHLPAVNEHLIEHLAELPRGRILVPLCGKTVDLWFLAERGYEVVGVELVRKAVDELFADAGVTPSVDGARWRGGGVEVVVGNFFALPSPSDGRFQAIWDRAALIAIEPAERARYRDRVLELLDDDGAYLLMAIEVHEPLEGPPFSLAGTEVVELFAAHGELRELEALPTQVTSRALEATARVFAFRRRPPAR